MKRTAALLLCAALILGLAACGADVEPEVTLPTPESGVQAPTPSPEPTPDPTPEPTPEPTPDPAPDGGGGEGA